MTRHPLRRAVWPLLATVALVGVLFVGVFPTRTFLAQRAATNEAEEQLEVLQEQNAALEARVDRLHDDAEIERLAREQYNLVRPGEEAYAVLPPPSAAGPGAADEDGDDGSSAAGRDEGRNLLEQAWDVVTGLF